MQQRQRHERLSMAYVGNHMFAFSSILGVGMIGVGGVGVGRWRVRGNTYSGIDVNSIGIDRLAVNTLECVTEGAQRC